MSIEIPLRTAVEAEKKLRLRRLIARERHRYDYYGEPCGCVCTAGQCREDGCTGCGRPLGLGECKAHLRARRSQRPPGSPGSTAPDGSSLEDRIDWDVWLLNAGRGFGKTWTGAVFVTDMVDRREWTNIALVNETVKDVRTIQIPALAEVCPPWLDFLYEPSKATCTWTDRRTGEALATATIYSAEEPDQLRGPNFDGAWVDELAKYKHRQQDTWDMLQLCMRKGDHPRVVVTTTPRPTPTFIAVMSDERTVVTGGSTFENKTQLAGTFLRSIQRKFGGTRLGEQELNAVVLLDAPGALWTTALLESTRVKPGAYAIDGLGRQVPLGVEFVQIVVAVDPSVAANTADPDSVCECGIVIVGRATSGHAYVLDDRTIKGTPREWAEAVLRAYRDWHADLIVAEKNNGGALVEEVIRNGVLDGRAVGTTAPIQLVWAAHGKKTRAQPVSMLFEQGVMHIVGSLPALEHQLTTWNPNEDKTSPDRLDAMVWGGHATMVALFDQGGPIAA